MNSSHACAPEARSDARSEDARTGNIIELRKLLEQRFPPPPATTRSRLKTGDPALDDLLLGGLIDAAVTEIVCPGPSMGSATIIHALIEGAHATGRHLALVDADNSFDPDGQPGEYLAGLLWVRCAGPPQAVKATDLLLRDGNLPLVVLDLMGCVEREVRAIPGTYWYRLQRITEANGSVALVLTPVPVVASAVCNLRLCRRFGLDTLDLLRGQLTAQLSAETGRSRAVAFPGRDLYTTSLAVG